MWIESVAVEGFRSFRDQIEVNFDHRHNAVVGRNGSGKSSLLSSILHVLKPKERKRDMTIFHESSDRPVAPSAKIEVVFNNQNRRLSNFDTDQVKLTWIMGSKKDSIYVNGSATTFETWRNILSTAGMTRDNFFAIQQGETNNLAMASPRQRMKMLEDFAGLDDSEKKSERSAQNLQKSNEDLEKLRQAIEKHDAEIESLASQSNELTKYKDLSKKRNILVLVLSTRERQHIVDKMNQHQNAAENQETRAALDEINTRLKEKFDHKDEILANIEASKAQIKDFESNKKSLQDDLEFRVKEMQTLNDRFETTQAERDEMEQNRGKAEQEMIEIGEKIESEKTELKEIDGKIQEIQQFYEEIEMNINERQRKIDMFNLKLGRQDLDEHERQANIEAHLSSVEASIESCQASMSNLTKKMESVQNEAKNVQKSKENLDQEIQELQRGKDELDVNELRKMRQNCAELSSEDKLLQIELMRCQEKANSSKLKMTSSMERLRFKSRPLMDSIKGIETVLKRISNNPQDSWILEGYQGVVGSLIECESSMELAVSVSIGNRLFHHIVSSANVAQELLKRINNMDLPGEYNFIPLDKIMVREFQYPDNDHVKPLISLVKYPEHLSLAFEHLFSRKMVIRDLKYFGQIRQAKVDVVTLDGQQQSSKGFLTGGFYKKEESKLTLFKAFTNARDDYEQVLRVLTSHELKGREIHRQLSENLEKKNKLEAKFQNIQSSLDKAGHEMSLINRQIQSQDALMQKLEATFKEKEKVLQEEQANKESIEKEINGDFSQNTQEERETQSQWISELKKLKTNLSKTLKKKLKNEKRRNELNNNLELLNSKYEETLQLVISPRASKTLLATISAFSEENNALKSAIESLKSDISEVDSKLDELCQNDKKLQENLNKVNDKIENLEKKQADIINKANKMMEMEKQLKVQLDECDGKIYQQPSVLDMDLTKYDKFSTKQCTNELKKINKKLEKMSQVNLKASDLHQRYEEELAKLRKEFKDCEKSIEALETLWQTLEESKSRKVNFTFKQVDKYFSEIFKILVPRGNAFLRFEFDDSPSASAAVEQPKPSSLGVHVSFDGGEETKELAQLSGGQKTIVALAYMFALQKADPSPIYIFDEIDAHLDENARQKVAQWLLDTKDSGSQFITTTFRRQLVENADKIVGIKMVSGASKALDLDKTDALQFITQAQFE